MKTTPRSIPGIATLYWADYSIRRTFFGFSFGAMVLVGCLWMQGQPPSPILPREEVEFNAMLMRYGAIAGGVFSAISALLLAWRYLFVTKVLREGHLVTGKAVKVERWDTNMHGDSSTGMKTRATYVNYVNIRYTMHHREHTVRFKLMHSPSTYGIKQDGDTDLLVHDSAPGNPLIVAVYYARR